MARVVSPNRVLSAPVSLPPTSIAQEFIRHRECLARQREYFSEACHHRRRPRAGARARPPRSAVRERRCRPVDGTAASPIQRRYRPLRLVGSQAASLTDLLPKLRADLHDDSSVQVSRASNQAHLVRPRYHAASSRAFSNQPFSSSPPAKLRGRWPWRWRARMPRHAGPRRRLAARSGRRTACAGCSRCRRRSNGSMPSHPSPNAASEAAGRRALALCGREPVGRCAGRPVCPEVRHPCWRCPAAGLSLAGQDHDGARADECGRSDRGSQLRAQTSLGM